MKTTNPKATKTVYPIICQVVNTIPHQFIAETATSHKVLSRTFTPKSHVAAMLYCQVSTTESLNSICDIAQANETLWRSMGVTPPMRNTFANANAHRPADMAKDLYWKTFSFSRLAAIIRGTLWIRRNIVETLCLHGTAGPAKSDAERPKRLYFQAILDFGPIGMGQQTCRKGNIHGSLHHRVEKPTLGREKITHRLVRLWRFIRRHEILLCPNGTIVT